jgi:hypothetical protein
MFLTLFYCFFFRPSIENNVRQMGAVTAYNSAKFLRSHAQLDGARILPTPCPSGHGVPLPVSCSMLGPIVFLAGRFSIHFPYFLLILSKYFTFINLEFYNLRSLI